MPGLSWCDTVVLHRFLLLSCLLQRSWSVGRDAKEGAVVCGLRTVTGQPCLLLTATSSEGPAPHEGRVRSLWQARHTSPWHHKEVPHRQKRLGPAFGRLCWPVICTMRRRGPLQRCCRHLPASARASDCRCHASSTCTVIARYWCSGSSVQQSHRPV